MILSEDQIAAIQDYFQHMPVLKAFLFGSYAKGEGMEESDIDILVELDYSTHIGLGFVDMKMDLEDRQHKKVDLVSSKSISKHLLPFVNQDTRLIYER